MGALPPISATWIPEDDLALKKAVEAGASLEAIARGVVRFSRKFSIGEVQDRWYSLLYDPVVSKEAAYGMTEFEKSTTPLPSRLNKTKEHKLVPAKRKPESVRSCYHALRKRIRNEPFNSLDMNFLLTPSSSNHIGNGDEPNFPLVCDEFQLKDSDMGGEFSFQPESMHSEISHVLPSEFEIFELPDPECGEPFPNLDYSSPSPEWRTVVEDISSSAIPMTTQDKFVLPDLTRASDKMTSCGVNADNYLEELSHSLLNFTNEEELFFMDADGKDLIDKSYYDGLNSLLQNEITQEDHNLNNETKPEGHTSPTASEFELSDGPKTSNSEDKTVSSSEFTVCLLNTEDIDIPGNADIALRYRSSSSSVLGRRFAKSSASLFRDLSWYPKTIPKEKTQSRRIGNASQENGKLHHTADGGLPNGRVSSNRDSKVSPLPVPPKLKEEKIETTAVKQISHKSADSKEKVDSRPKTNGTKQEADVQMEFHDHQLSNPELSLDEQHIESDDEIPHFSDVEAMILDMDLDPEDLDIYEQEVSKYLHENAMKGIIRLEQGAHSCIQRDIASHGAFAILYGRLSKHYIKKPEVLIGRTTEDMIVDIDLGRGGIGNRISRRQALISMDKDGSFRLTNLGKYPVLINNKEVTHGEVLSIAPNSLIEIRGMPFIFDTNKSCVKKFLERKET